MCATLGCVQRNSASLGNVTEYNISLIIPTVTNRSEIRQFSLAGTGVCGITGPRYFGQLDYRLFRKSGWNAEVQSCSNSVIYHELNNNMFIKVGSQKTCTC